MDREFTPGLLGQFYDDRKQEMRGEGPQGHDGPHGDHGMMDVSHSMGKDLFLHKLMKCRDKLKDKCAKHLIIDIYTKILPLDKEYIDGHHGKCCDDVDKMLAAKKMDGLQYLKSCSDATKAPLLEYLLRSIDTIANEYYREEKEEMEEAEKNQEKVPEPETPEPEEDDAIANQLVDVKKDTEYEDFIEKLKKKTINRIVSDVSKIIMDKKEDAQMQFTTNDTPEEESPVGEAVDYIQKQLWKESQDLSPIQDDIVGYAIREATLRQMNLCFKQPDSLFQEYASRVRMGKGYVITEQAVQELQEKLQQE